MVAGKGCGGSRSRSSRRWLRRASKVSHAPDKLQHHRHHRQPIHVYPRPTPRVRSPHPPIFTTFDSPWLASRDGPTRRKTPKSRPSASARRRRRSAQRPRNSASSSNNVRQKSAAKPSRRQQQQTRTAQLRDGGCRHRARERTTMGNKRNRVDCGASLRPSGVLVAGWTTSRG